MRWPRELLQAGRHRRVRLIAALFAFAPEALVLADARPPALLALAPLALVLAVARPPRTPCIGSFRAGAGRCPPPRTPCIGGRRPGSPMGQPWVPDFWGQPWVPAPKSSTVGPRDQFSLLRALGYQTKLSTFDTVAFRVRRRPDRFHALRRTPPLHSPCQKFGNTDYFLKIPAKAKMRCSGGSPVISCEGRKMLQRTHVRQVFRRGII